MGKIVEVFEFIVRYKTAHNGNSPSHRDICDACGVTSTSVVDYYLEQLQRRGAIKLSSDVQARSIEVVGGRWTFDIDENADQLKSLAVFKKAAESLGRHET